MIRVDALVAYELQPLGKSQQRWSNILHRLTTLRAFLGHLAVRILETMPKPLVPI